MADAQQAADRLRQNWYDVLISDIRMPGNAELEFIRNLRQLAPGTPVILVTGYPSIDTAVEAIELPVVAYMTKPVDFDELLAKVAAAVRRSRVFRRAHEAGNQMERWCQKLRDSAHLLEESDDRFAAEPVEALATMNLRAAADSLDQLHHLIGELSANRSREEREQMAAAAQLETAYNAIREAITVLEQTKSLFKSKQLARLRRKLQNLAEQWRPLRKHPQEA